MKNFFIFITTSIVFFSWKINAQNISMNDIETITWNQAFNKIYDAGLKFERPSAIINNQEAFIFIYTINKDEKIVISEYPNSGISRNEFPAFIYRNEELLTQAIKSLNFPIPDRFNTILHKEKESINQIAARYNDYIIYFDSIMGTNFIEKITSKELAETHDKIYQKHLDAEYGKLLLAYSIVVSKFIINSYDNAVFVALKKNEGFSPYFIPCVQINESILNPFELLGEVSLNEGFDKFFINVLMNSHPQLPEIKNKSTSELLIFLKNRGYFN